MSKATKAAIGFVSIPIVAIPLTALSIAIFGLNSWETQTSEYHETAMYLLGIWLGYIFWGVD